MVIQDEKMITIIRGWISVDERLPSNTGNGTSKLVACSDGAHYNFGRIVYEDIGPKWDLGDEDANKRAWRIKWWSDLLPTPQAHDALNKVMPDKIEQPITKEEIMQLALYNVCVDRAITLWKKGFVLTWEQAMMTAVWYLAVTSTDVIEELMERLSIKSFQNIHFMLEHDVLLQDTL